MEGGDFAAASQKQFEQQSFSFQTLTEVTEGNKQLMQDFLCS